MAHHLDKYPLVAAAFVNGEYKLAPNSIIPLPDTTGAPHSGGSKMTKSKREQEKQRAYRKNKLFRRIEADIKERDRKRVPGL